MKTIQLKNGMGRTTRPCAKRLLRNCPRQKRLRPLHGKSVATARQWVKPQYGTTDMYHAGEYMVYTDGKVYRCLSDTPYSPEEYAAAWEVYQA